MSTGAIQTGKETELHDQKRIPNIQQGYFPLEKAILLRFGRPNPAVQLTAFGARDRSVFEVIPCRAPRPQLNAKPLGGWGSVVDIPFVMVTSRSRCENARYARLVVPVRVMLAWFKRLWCGLPVLLAVIVCWSWFKSTLVVLVWFRADVVQSCWA